MCQIVWGDICHAEDNWKVLESLLYCYTSFPTGCRTSFPTALGESPVVAGLPPHLPGMLLTLQGISTPNSTRHF